MGKAVNIYLDEGSVDDRATLYTFHKLDNLNQHGEHFHRLGNYYHRLGYKYRQLGNTFCHNVLFNKKALMFNRPGVAGAVLQTPL